MIQRKARPRVASENSHHRAVALFSALVEAPTQGLHTSPASLTRIMDRPSSTGHRAVAEALTQGLLSRTVDGAFRPGQQALKIGLSAWGLGEVAQVIEPVLSDLRQAVRRSVFLGALSGNHVTPGPFSLGRGARYRSPARRYNVDEGSPRLIGPVRLPLTGEEREGRVIPARAIALPGRTVGAVPILVILPGPGWTEGEAEDGDAALTRAAARLSRVTDMPINKGEGQVP